MAVRSREEAAFLLGVHPAASSDDIQRMYEWSVQTHDPEDRDGLELLTQAREVLLRSRGAALRGQGAAPRRRGLSTGAIVGISIGGAAVLGVVALLAGIAVVGPGDLAGAFGPRHAASSTEGAVEVLDGVTVRYSGEGWTFLLDSPQDCPAAKVVVGFADTPGGESVDVLTDTAPLQAGVTYTYAPADQASTHPYAHIDEIVCHAM
ncbi:hypothetical protein [Leifsonia aquatica]|uniref:hypothetical protein n=1 Tax=Leifsonia aquatica TaxID=144185 RepID=UPI0028A7FF7B|nr:hypothetical protein [Leifsonia aquatica]